MEYGVDAMHIQQTPDPAMLHSSSNVYHMIRNLTQATPHENSSSKQIHNPLRSTFRYVPRARGNLHNK